MNNRYLFKLILILFVYSIVPIQGSGTLSASVPHSHSAMFDIPQAALLPGSDTCLPPANLIISSSDLQNISIHWDAPSANSVPKTLAWSSDVISSFIGFSTGDYKISMVQRYCGTDLTDCHNKELTSIRFYAHEDADVYKVVVYKGGSYNGNYLPGTLLVEQNIDLNSLTLNAWNTVTLNTPVPVDASQEIWFGIYLEAEAGTCCIPICTESVPSKGSILGTHTSGTVSWTEYSPLYSFGVSGIVEDNREVTGYQVSRDGISIGSTTSTSLQDFVNSTGTYIYTVTANWSNNCSASAQKSFTSVPQLTASPDVLDFHTASGFGSSVHKVSVIGNGLTAGIQAVVTGNFLISSDSTTYSSTVTLPSIGGVLFVQYIPGNVDSETGTITLTSGNLHTTVSLIGQNNGDCAPPQNLTLSNANGIIDLHWDSAEMTQCEDLTWLDDVSGISYGSVNPIERYFVQRFNTDDLVPYQDKYLTAISFIPTSAVTSLKLVVFQGGGLNGGNYLTSGTQVCDQTINLATLTNDTWNTIPLEEPIVISADQELWFGLYVEAPANTSPIRMATPYVAQKGSIYRGATTAANHWTEYNTNQAYCFALKASIEDAPTHLTHYQIDRNAVTVGERTANAFIDTVTTTGDYTYDVWAVWSNGCRAFTRGNITVSTLCHPEGNSYTEMACESYEWNNEVLTQSGTYTHEYTDLNGCPQVDTLHLTVNHSTTGTDTQVACGSFTWIDGVTYTESTTAPTFTLTNAQGCDSVVTLHLTINNPTNGAETVTAYDTYTWTGGNGQTYNASGTYYYQHTDGNGCTQVDTLYLTVYYSSSSEFAATACESYEWDGRAY
ncbi:MAG: hypothetical protein IKO81_06850, partial [Bacteroidales bacterium]|nr:hypothetical protein [Bacteroidales bacterium]